MITTKKVLSIIAIAIMVAIVSVACKKKPTDANASAEVSLVLADIPEESGKIDIPEETGKANSNLPTWDKNYALGRASDLVGVWSGQWLRFSVDSEGNLNFNNVALADDNAVSGNLYAGYNFKLPEYFQYPLEIELVFTTPGKWKMEPMAEKGKFIFYSPTSVRFTGYLVQKLDNYPYVEGWTSYPYGWTRITIQDNGTATRVR